VLAVPDLDKKLRVKVDTSNYATGDMLSIKMGDGNQLLFSLSH